MAWTSPATFTDGAVLTGAQLNTNLRDNLLETAPAKATAAGRIFVATGANSIAERVITQAVVATSESTTSTSYTNLATSGPAVTVTTGVRALVCISCQLTNGTANDSAVSSYAVSGASTIASSDSYDILAQPTTSNNFMRASAFHMTEALTAGSNTFTQQYRSGAGGTANFRNRQIVVIGL